MNKFEANKIIDPTVVNPMAEIESTSTDFITENFFGNKNYRFNFYWLIQKLFDKYKELIINDDLLMFKPYIFLIFKGGNIIKAVIDKAEDNIIKTIVAIDNLKDTDDLKTEYSLNEFNPTKRSDSDFSVFIDFPRIGSMLSNNQNKDLIFIKLIIASEFICYNILDEIRKNYNHEKGTVKIPTDLNLLNKNQSYIELTITNLSENIDKLDKLNKNYNEKFNDLIKKNVENIEKIKTESDNESLKDFIKNPKNIVFNFIKIFGSDNIKFNKNLNFESPTLFDNKVAMPKIVGFIINDKINYNIKEINENNSISLNKLVGYTEDNKKYSASHEKLSAYKKDVEMYFANNQNIPLLADDNSLFNIKKENPNNMYMGYSINNIDFDNNFLFKNYKNLSYNNLIKYEISNIKIKQSKNDNELYISSNRTLRFTKNNKDKTAFNLVRTKHNFKVFFELPYSIIKINGQNTNIRYVYLDIPGEFIDITVPTFADDALITYMNNFDKYITKRMMTIQLPNNQTVKQEIYTYSNYGLIHDIENIIYNGTDNMPWVDNKYSKRLERLFRLYFAEIKDKLKINDKIKSQLDFIESTLSLIKKKYQDYKETNKYEFIQIIQQNIGMIYYELKIIDDFMSESQKTPQNFFRDMFISVLGPIDKFNKNIQNNNDADLLDKIISYLDDVIKYYKIFVDNISLPAQGNLSEIQLGGYYQKYLKYKQKYLQLKYSNQPNVF